MLEKIVFADSKGETSCMSNDSLISAFLDLFNEEFKGEREYFRKIDSINKFVDFSFQVEYLPTADSKIHKLDEVKFISDALRTAKHCRVIDDEVYREMNQIALYDKGEHVIAVDGEPFFKIVENESKWAYRPLTFAFYNKKDLFKHTFDVFEIDKKPREQISIEINTEKPREEHILVQMYNHMKKHYEKKELGVVTETIDGTKKF